MNDGPFDIESSGPELPSPVSQLWGVPDFIWCFLAGTLGAITVSTLSSGFGINVDSRLYLFGALLPAQEFAMIAAVVTVSRTKGLRSLHRDFGFGIRWNQAWVAIAVIPLAIFLDRMTAPLFELGKQTESPQGIVRELHHSSGALLTLAILLSTCVLVPITEELLFRGLLLRALRKRTTAGWSLFISSAVFGAAHMLGSADAFLVVPSLMAFGFVLGVFALRDGSLSRPIFLHAGFNLLTVVVSLSSVGLTAGARR